MKAILSVFRLRVREELQYRGAVIGGIICQAFFGLILVSVYRALYETRPQALPLQHVVNYVWLQQAFFRMMLGFDGELNEKIRTGSFAYDLCRPLEVYWYYYARNMAIKLVGSVMRSVPMLALALLLPEGWGLRAPASFQALLCALVSLGLGLLNTCAMASITTGFTVRTLDGRGIESALNLLMMTFSGNLIPLTLFPDSWQTVICLTPYAQMLDAPIRIYCGEQALATAPAIWLIQAVWAGLLILAGKALWDSNQKRITVQGG